MKVVILAGGYGTRISEESHLKPKPMIEIGDKPILWHIMKIYSHYGFNDFVICLGYKGYIIKEFFAQYYLHASDVTFDFTNGNSLTVHNNVSEPWRVTLVDTGLDTMTGGRIKRIEKYIGNERFMLTYGDGVSDVDLNSLEKYHNEKEGWITMTAIQPGGRFGVLEIEEHSNRIKRFSEKSKEDGGWINGGFMIVEPEVFNVIDDDASVFESDTLTKIAEAGNLNAFKHHGFWQCMDTQRDKGILENLWRSGVAPWKIW
ncbi:glucose-1-phosphate cytidylyltransferase [Bacillus sp. FJAT-27264]|uniref:glucose-1-phosphate cytidylyltransferase n=1 Tax=Paenibacillus sp. (strain DSM 101736 / FJAT-27264) TaxID=1850362 RepID=UPI000808159C|nr:glucose-1-phosphate cytidylyltransferase [Bacillus sp. FJAT-27264]OBZ07888.1 glucose-1-phosphate cytidylyltransferase [Bacillus sp. FJAT-27264]